MKHNRWHRSDYAVCSVVVCIVVMASIVIAILIRWG